MRPSIRFTALVSALVLGTLFLPGSSGAQQGTASPASLAVVAPPSVQQAADSVVQAPGPRLNRDGIALATLPVLPDLAMEPVANVGVGPNVALMGVGVAAVIIGSMVEGNGGTAIQLGGGVAFFLGLFRYLR